ncbi:C-X-C chemokine receptor type 1 [Astyanax mexicanus]|uniref:C-X-C chemokine receptor type 1 n=1 Tax=Astyanax mexicanus TaxID=7994 RepID=UPI0020CB0A7C|nr:C-X-C chemokine receptor type 1 [Astyanax mexicanus]
MTLRESTISSMTEEFTTDYTEYNLVMPCSETLESVDSTAVAISYTVVFLLSLVGNSVVIYVIYMMQSRRTSTDVYLMNLALADLLFSLTLPFEAACIYASSWIFGTVLCKMLSGLQEATFYGCVFLLACISIDRYMAIVRATQFISKQHCLVRTVCGLVWLGATTLSLPVVVQREALQESNGYRCYENLTADNIDKWRVGMRILRHTVGFFLPLAIMVFCYGWTMGTLFRSRNSQKHKAMRVILCVVLAFVVCWLPNNITELINTLIEGDIIDDTCELRNKVGAAMYVTQALAFIHCAINPLLYAFIGKKFRNQLCMIFFKKGLIGREVLSRYRIGSLYSSGSSRHTSVTL